MESKLLDIAPMDWVIERRQILTAAVAFCLLFILYSYQRPSTLHFERVGRSWWLQLFPAMLGMKFSVVDSIQAGYDKINKSGKPFVIKWWARDFIILPPKYLQDLKKADFDKLNFFRVISDTFSLPASVGDLYHSNIMIDVITRYLNPQLGSIIPLLKDECDYAFEKEVGGGQEWKTIKAQACMGKIMHRTSSRVLVGEEICRSDRFIETSMAFTFSIFINGVSMALLPMGPFRKQLSYLGSWVHRRHLRRVVEQLQPIVEKRMAERRQSKDALSQHKDAVQWTIEVSQAYPPKENNASTITMQVLHNLWAGSTAPGGLCTQMLFQMLFEPEYIPQLRDEISKAIDKYGWQEKAFQNMPLLDSFIREINRIYQVQSITCARTPLGQPFKLHDGLVLPAGSRVGFASLAIQTDPKNFADPLKFDGFRFARIRERDVEGSEHDEDDGLRWGAATPATTNLVFGYGKHACPGRFYSVRTVKIIFSKLLLEYDIKFPDNVTKRPESFTIEGQFGPNPDQVFCIRKRAET